jgi:small-conductance mechanosensitive channel
MGLYSLFRDARARWTTLAPQQEPAYAAGGLAALGLAEAIFQHLAFNNQALALDQTQRELEKVSEALVKTRHELTAELNRRRLSNLHVEELEAQLAQAQLAQASNSTEPIPA